MGIRVTVSATLKGGVAEGGGVSEKSSTTTTLFLKGGGGGGSSGSAVFKVAEIGSAKARPDLMQLARRLDRLAPSATRPEDYFAEKSEIAHALRRMARRGV
jgi:hypothetical protein